MFEFGQFIGIDLGTANIVIVVKGQGIVLNEPSVVAVSAQDQSIVALGLRAKEMLGRTPEDIVAHRPLRDGVIADYRMTQAMLRYFIEQIGGKVRLARPTVLVSIPAGITSTEKRAVIEAVTSAGAKKVYTIKEPIAAAIGAEIPIASTSGNMIVDIGGGTTEVAVISLGGVAVAESLRVGGVRFDQSIREYVRKRYNLAIGDGTAEEVKLRLGSASTLENENDLEIRGRDMVSGLPTTVRISTNQVAQALSGDVGQIVGVIRSVLEKTPPELASDIVDKGIVLTGGGAQLRYLPQVISNMAKIPVTVVPDPLLAVARGIEKVLENFPEYQRSVAIS